MTPNRGDILHLQFDPATGKEMCGNHFCLVVSPKAFNQRFGLVMVCPISGGQSKMARNSGFLISLMGLGLKTDGCVHAHQVKTLDWAARKAKRVEKAPDEVVRQISHCLTAVLEDSV